MSYRTHRKLNIVLAILYMPISLFGFVLGMATEEAIGETNRLIIAACYSLAHLGMLSPIAVWGGLILSYRLFDKGHIVASHFARFLGLIFIAVAFFLYDLFHWLAQYFG